MDQYRNLYANKITVISKLKREYICNLVIHFVSTYWSSGMVLGYKTYLSTQQTLDLIFGVNSFWPSDAIWWHRSGWTLVQAMACCLMAITSTNIDLSWKMFCGIYLRAISEKMLVNLFYNLFSKIRDLKLPPHHPEDNEWIKDTGAWWHAILMFVVGGDN